MKSKVQPQAGDLVEHITGGPVMSVVAVTLNGSMIATSWWDEGSKSFQSGWFMNELIEECTPRPL